MSADREEAGRRPRVLIVDDEPVNRQLLEAMLSSEDLVLQTASSGEEALALTAAQPPDLILLDIMMPGLDGYQVAAKIKGDRSTVNIPVIMVTSLDDRASRMFGLSAGAEDFLTKPVDRFELCVRVRILLKLKALADYHDHYRQVLEAEVRARTADLQKERDRAQSYLDTAGVILLALDNEGRITLVNRYACTTLGWTAEELLGKDWVETCVPERIWGAIRGKFREIIGGELPISEDPIVTRGGGERLINWQSTILRDEDGQITGSLSSGTDVTERAAAVEALRVSDERMRFALETANVGIWDMDYATGSLRWSTVMEAQYGLQPGEFAGTFEAFVERVHPDDRRAVTEIFERAVRSGQDFAVQHRSLWPDGTVRWLRGIGRIILGARGQPLRGIGISLDITERHNLEAQFQQAQKMEAVGRLAGGVAHDFNNLLTVILGLSDLLLADADPDARRQRDIEEIQKAALLGAGLTRQLLAFSRKQLIVPTTLDLNALVTDMRDMLSRLIGEHVTIVVRLAPELPPVLADRGQMEQLLMNLAVNARDAMLGGGTLTLETAATELDEHYARSHLGVKPGVYVGLTVTDTGTGMTPEVQARLFEPFFTTKEPGKGTGLGLAVVYGIVNENGGNIVVYSEVGRGTAFKVHLPPAPVETRETITEAPPPSVSIRKGSQTVLVVDDEAGVRDLTRRLLERQGYKVLVAGNATEAVAAFAGDPSIALLLTDVVMPGVSGANLTEELLAQRPGLRVIYMSGYTADVIANHRLLSPGIAFLNKPFTVGALVEKVHEVLTG